MTQIKAICNCGNSEIVLGRGKFPKWWCIDCGKQLNFSMVETKPKPPFVSGACKGELCWCGKDASHKVEETIFDDDPRWARHPLTRYICHDHFVELMGPAANATAKGAPHGGIK
jgi:hypothetical protein